MMQKSISSETGYHSIIEIKKSIWRSSCPTLLFKQGHLKPVKQDNVQTALEYLQDFTISLATYGSAWSCSEWKILSWYSEETFCVSVCAHCLW